jgi:hypothetical protein
MESPKNTSMSTVAILSFSQTKRSDNWYLWSTRLASMRWKAETKSMRTDETGQIFHEFAVPKEVGAIGQPTCIFKTVSEQNEGHDFQLL